jgi:excisionase family DNA binding protein
MVAHARQPADDADELVERFLEVFVERLAASLADRVERRLEQLGSERSGRQALDVKQAAERLGVSDRTMHELVVSGKVPSVKVGRRRVIAAAAIDRLLAGESLPGALPGPDSGTSPGPYAARLGTIRRRRRD